MAVRPRTGSGLYRSLNKFPSRGARSVPHDESGTDALIRRPAEIPRFGFRIDLRDR